MTEIDVYATGVLADLQAIGRGLDPRNRHPESPAWRRKALRHFGRRLRNDLRRRNAWHGYHAEPRVCPPGLRRIGSGWTRRRALRSLEHYMAEMAS